MERRQNVQTKWRKSTSLLYKLQKSMSKKRKRESLPVETSDDFQRRILKTLTQRTAENAELKKRIAILEEAIALQEDNAFHKEFQTKSRSKSTPPATNFPAPFDSGDLNSKYLLYKDQYSHEYLF